MVLTVMGLLSTALTIVLSVVPGEDELNSPHPAARVLTCTAVLIGIGVAVLLHAERVRRK
jgi:glutamate:GABA antiporter